MEKMKYLFLDMEWSQENDFDVKENQILEFAVASYSNDFESQRRFARIVKPSDVYAIPERIYRFLNLSMESLMEEDAIDVVLDEFSQKFPYYEVVVVWNENTYKLFVEKCRSHHITLPKHKVLVLQDMIASIDSKKHIYSMERYLKKCGIRYKMDRLHYSKYDVERMRLLFLEIRNQYFSYLKGTTRKYYRSSSSATIHVKSCHFIQRMLSENRVLVEGRELLDGYSVCKCCRKKFPSIQFKANKKNVQNLMKEPVDEFDDEYIFYLCQRYGLHCQISDGVIFVKSAIATWRIYHNYQNVTEVFHQNISVVNRANAKKKKPLNVGFHKQEIKEKRLDAVLRYIHYHDKNYFGGKRSQKNKVEQLLEELEQKRKCEGM